MAAHRVQRLEACSRGLGKGTRGEFEVYIDGIKALAFAQSSNDQDLEYVVRGNGRA